MVAAVNRVFDYLAGQAAPPPPVPPSGEKEREAYWNETFFTVVAVLRQQLSSSNEGVRARAAHKIIDLERTKLRHGRRLDGTGEAPPPPTPPTPPHLIDAPRDRDLVDMRANLPQPSDPVAHFGDKPLPKAAGAPAQPAADPLAAFRHAGAPNRFDMLADEDDEEAFDERDEDEAMEEHADAVMAMTAEIAAELNAQPGPRLEGYDRAKAKRAVRILLDLAKRSAVSVVNGRTFFAGTVRRFLKIERREAAQPPE